MTTKEQIIKHKKIKLIISEHLKYMERNLYEIIDMNIYIEDDNVNSIASKLLDEWYKEEVKQGPI